MGVPASTVMPVPITPMNENSYFLLGKDNIGFARQCLVINPVPVSHRKEAAAYITSFMTCLERKESVISLI